MREDTHIKIDPKAANARRQREYRARRERDMQELQTLRQASNELEDSITYLAGKGEEVSVRIYEKVKTPSLSNLADYFRHEVMARETWRKPSRNRKKPPTAKPEAVAVS